MASGGPPAKSVVNSKQCSQLHSNVRSVWWSVVGDGTCFAATAVGADIDAVIAVYNKCSRCHHLECVTLTAYTAKEGVFWRSVPGETLHVVAGGYYGSGGTFDLLIEKSDCLLNDRCIGATSVIVDKQIRFTEYASTTFATAQSYNSPTTACSNIDESARAIWYTLSGDGACLKAFVIRYIFEPALALYRSYGSNCN